MKKPVIFFFFLIIGCLNAKPYFIIKNKTTADEIKIEKSTLFKGKEMQALYIAKFDNGKSKRYFEVIKTNPELKSFFLADYLLIEKQNNKMIYYPMGWTTDKIKPEEIKANCLLIISGKISAVKID